MPMHERPLLLLFLGLNVALGGVFLGYVALTGGGAAQTSAHRTATSPATHRPGIGAAEPAGVSVPVAVSPGRANSRADAPPSAGSFVARPAPGGKAFTWEDLESDAYPAYLESLRAVGCPEEKVRQIALADIGERHARRLRQIAVEEDIAWWRTDVRPWTLTLLQERARGLEEERRRLVTRLLGADAVGALGDEGVYWTHVALTGAELGGLPADTHARVQELWARAQERLATARRARQGEGRALTAAEEARLLEATRQELDKVLTAEQLEAFLLRFSDTAVRLRAELQGIEPTPEEFRRCFRTVDALEQPLRVQFGGPEALGTKERERFVRQRAEAIRQSLRPESYLAYLARRGPERQ